MCGCLCFDPPPSGLRGSCARTGCGPVLRRPHGAGSSAGRQSISGRGIAIRVRQSGDHLRLVSGWQPKRCAYPRHRARYRSTTRTTDTVVRSVSGCRDWIDSARARLGSRAAGWNVDPVVHTIRNVLVRIDLRACERWYPMGRPRAGRDSTRTSPALRAGDSRLGQRVLTQFPHVNHPGYG